MNQIKIQNLSKDYFNVKALNKININITEGSLFGILGPNGAGKTTLLRTLATLISPDEGTIKINNIDVIKEPRKIRELIGYVAQEIALDKICLLYTSPSPRDSDTSRMPSSA